MVMKGDGTMEQSEENEERVLENGNPYTVFAAVTRFVLFTSRLYFGHSFTLHAIYNIGTDAKKSNTGNLTICECAATQLLVLTRMLLIQRTGNKQCNITPKLRKS